MTTVVPEVEQGITSRFMRYSDLPGHQLRRAAIARGEKAPHVCMWCCGEIERGRRRSWCSSECVTEYLIRSSASAARAAVFERDRGVCTRCRIDTESIRVAIDDSRRRAIAQLDRDPRAEDRRNWRTTWYYEQLAAVTAEYARLLRSRLKVGSHGHLWEAHHITAVVEGGGWCGLDGYETCCMKCHHAESAALQRRRRRASA